MLLYLRAAQLRAVCCVLCAACCLLATSYLRPLISLVALQGFEELLQQLLLESGFGAIYSALEEPAVADEVVPAAALTSAAPPARANVAAARAAPSQLQLIVLEWLTKWIQAAGTPTAAIPTATTPATAAPAAAALMSRAVGEGRLSLWLDELAEAACHRASTEPHEEASHAPLQVRQHPRASWCLPFASCCQ